MNTKQSLELETNAPTEISKILHVGLPKTGSTAIQHFLFSRHPNIEFFSVSSNGGRVEHQAELDNFLSRVMTDDEVTFDYSRENEFVQNHICSENRQAQCYLVSAEGFTGRFGESIGMKAIRLKKLFPDYKVLIVIRRPQDLLAAQYIQTAANLQKRRFFYGLPSFQNWVEEGLANPNHPLSPMLSLQFHKISMMYSDLFGKANIKVMAYEHFRQAPENFIRELSEFLHIDPVRAYRIFSENNRVVNSRRSAQHLVHQKIRENMVVKQFPKGIQRGLAKFIEVTFQLEKYYNYIKPETYERVIRFSLPETEAVSREWGLDLKEYGY